GRSRPDNAAPRRDDNDARDRAHTDTRLIILLAVRTNLLDAIAKQVNGYHLRPELDYDYEYVRKRLIFETLTQGVQYVCNNAVEGDIAEFGTASGFSSYTMARAL